MKKVTIKEVARAAGVSPMTVSRVLNDRPDVSATTRQRVQGVIHELGYRPNAVARSLIRGESLSLGVAVFGLEHYGPSHTVVGVEKMAEELGYSMVVALMHLGNPRRKTQEQILSNLSSRQVDGIVWAIAEHEDNRDWLCRQARELPIPVVFLNMKPRPDVTMVAINNYGGARQATEHLLKQGYRRIGHIAGPMNWWEAAQREAGWRDAVHESGLPTKGLEVFGDWSAASGDAGMQRLLEQAPDIEALFASNDQMALGALRAARSAGRRVPEDLAVVGFDDIPEAAYFHPPLTTIRQDLQRMGTLAVQLVHRMIENDKQGEDSKAEVLWVQPELITRKSSIVSSTPMSRESG
jgi:DNA-binding LacI/PurR family transcriptional regulator